jgi:hypothetical protein
MKKKNARIPDDEEPVSLVPEPSPATQRALQRMWKRMCDAQRGDNHDAERLEEEDV